MNHLLTEPQCKKWSAMQMHPRPLVAVDSVVKHTALTMVHGNPLSEIDPGAASVGTMVAA